MKIYGQTHSDAIDKLVGLDGDDAYIVLAVTGSMLLFQSPFQELQWFEANVSLEVVTTFHMQMLHALIILPDSTWHVVGL